MIANFTTVSQEDISFVFPPTPKSLKGELQLLTKTNPTTTNRQSKNYSKLLSSGRKQQRSDPGPRK